MSEVVEVNSSPVMIVKNPSRSESPVPVISAPPYQLSRSPLILDSDNQTNLKSPFSVITPLASPMKKAMKSMQNYLEEIGHLTKLDPQEDWLPITESRNGNAYYAAFHTLSSGIGIQALVLPLAFTALGWTWGIICLSLAFVWQLYTLWLLIQLHESVPGTRHSRYLLLSMAAFGNKLGKLMALLPTMYLSSGTCITLIMIGGAALKIFFQIVCSNPTCNANSITTVEWYIVFTCSAVILAQLPNLNSIAGVSLIGAATAVTYCTLTWVLSVTKNRPSGISYEPLQTKSDIANICSILNALGIIAFTFRGHNLALEIQGTMPSSLKHPSHLPMWKGVKFSYLIIACCLFPLAIGGYWAYGNFLILHSDDNALFHQMPTNAGILSALDQYHVHDTSKVILGLTSLLVLINSLTSFQIYAMPVFDNFEFKYTRNQNRACPWWVRTALRVFFGCLALFVAIALPFLPSLAGLIGGIALPVTLAYPCLMWIMIKKPEKYSAMWYLNWSLGSLGLILSILLVLGAIWTIVTRGIEAHFFKPQ
ncbi:lysine histidine transporter-like 8 [Olea europaea subsp. europaea]|uniref:Lysine histidine transporter-like 8 n=1 Tax=Olea europaea subsp. europaea TaxID=158383 RepID=A0A8S0Q4P2_OLEEU|nr:lysine histidine transporter-like 8 [Olea europaea subsp. europaea]